MTKQYVNYVFGRRTKISFPKTFFQRSF